MVKATRTRGRFLRLRMVPFAPSMVPSIGTRLRDRFASDQGFTLIEMLIVTSLLLVIVAATLTALEVTMRAQNRDQAYAQEITQSQASLARLIHDLRQATLFQSVTPNAIRFQMIENGTTYNVRYDCTATDSLGSPYTRCAQTQAVSPATPASPSNTVGSLDIQHVSNGSITNFCNSAGTGTSGAVFFVSNPSIPNTDGSTAVCDEAYERMLASLGGGPDYVQVQVQVPARGNLRVGGLTHTTVLTNSTFLPNLDAGS